MTDVKTTPRRIEKLVRDKRGFPVPWFVAWIDGEPDFRVIRPGGIQDAMRFDLCWVCGERRGANAAFVIGPMCAINRVSAEPPSHRDCAVYSATHCPFLTHPGKPRREAGMDRVRELGARNAAGVMIPRNPGVALVWVSRTWKPFYAPSERVVSRTPLPSEVLFDVGEPVETQWFAEGRAATRAEVLASIESGTPILRGVAEEEGPDALAELERLTERAMVLVPEGVR